MKKSISWLLFLFLSIAMISCGKESYKLESEMPADYFNLAPGKYIIYQLDSLVKVPFSDTSFMYNSYQAKDLVDTVITDNLGRKSWRIFRYMRPVNSTDDLDWEPSDTYFITPTREVVEVVENNLRYLKIVLPISVDKTWKGNTYILTNVAGTTYDYLDNWTYSYQQIGRSFAPFQTAVDSTITVLQADESNNVTNGVPSDSSGKSSINVDAYLNYSVEVYAKNIGLIYKDLVHWDFQAANTQYKNGLKNGGGIRLRMISHN